MCECTAWIESRFNWLEYGDKEDGRFTSVGLFQDHIGGELGNHPLTYALNPLNACNLSIPNLARCAKLHPGWPIGKVAALAQGPFDPVTYAVDVQAVYDDVNKGKPPTGYLSARNKHTDITIPG
jgi:hypothetical protein